VTVRGDDGASAVEYALLVGAIAALIVIVIFALGSTVRSLFSDTCSRIDAKVTSTGSC
jgi:pilus assembly protein Flp/PilA